MDKVVRILENSPTITGNYDKEADVLYLSLGEAQPAIAVELGDGLVARYNEETQTIVGITAIGLRQRVLKELNSKIHVLPQADGWVVSEETAESSERVFSTQEAALKYAVSLAKTQWLEVVIHAEDGEIQEVINPGMEALLERRCKQRESEPDNQNI